MSQKNKLNAEEKAEIIRESQKGENKNCAARSGITKSKLSPASKAAGYAYFF